MRLHVNSITNDSSAEKLREVTSAVEAFLSPVISTYPAGSVNTLHLITICVSDDPAENTKWIEANHKVHRAKGPSGSWEKVVSIAIPLRPKDVAAKTIPEVNSLYLTILRTRLSMCTLKLPADFSLNPIVGRLGAANATSLRSSSSAVQRGR